MNALVLALLFVAQLAPAEAKKCSECATEYGKAKTSAAADNDAMCKAIKDYLTCLSTATDCPLEKTSADLIKTDHDAIKTDCSLSDVCTCQKTFFQTDQTGTAQCGAVTTFYHCLTQADKTHTACDGTSTVSALAKAAESFIPKTCAAKTDTCDCQITYTKADISDDAKKCTAAKNFISCLVGKTKPGCNNTVTVKKLASDAKTITDSSSCSTSDVCDCEIAYAIADVSTPASRCTETKKLTGCIQTSIKDGCGESTKKTDVGSAAQAAFTELTAPVCVLTATCQCQVDFNKADVTSSKKCSSSTTFETCLNGIKTAKEVGCDGSTDTSSLTTDIKTKVEDVLCSTAGLEMRSSMLISLLMVMVAIRFLSF